MRVKIKNFAGEAGLGIGAVYAFFMITPVNELFLPQVIIVLRQVLVVGFAICILINPKGLVEMGEAFAPKLIKLLTLLFKKDED